MVRNLFAGIVLAGVACTAQASVTLSASLTADNLFEAYISTSPTLAGVNFLSGGSWSTTFNGSTLINGAGTYYLHIIAVDQGGPRMMIGEFSLDSIDATFANGTQSLLTNTSDWTVSDTGLGLSPVAPNSFGINSAPSTWGTRPGISGDAEFIWHPDFPSTAYFSTPITIIPTPGALTAGLLGLATLARRSRR